MCSHQILSISYAKMINFSLFHLFCQILCRFVLRYILELHRIYCYILYIIHFLYFSTHLPLSLMTNIFSFGCIVKIWFVFLHQHCIFLLCIFCETTLPLFFLELIFHRTFIFKFALRVCSFFIALLCFKPMTLHILYVCLVGIGLGA